MGDALGWLGAVGAIVGFGLFSLPTRAVPSGDGFCFQLAMCSGIFFVGACVHLVQCAASAGCPTFTTLPALGGAIWCVSNLLLVPLVNALGIGRVMLLWGAAEMLTGWASATFGLFGLRRETVALPALNYAGVALGIVSIIVLAYAGGESSTAAAPAVSSGSDSDGALPVALVDTTPLLLSRGRSPADAAAPAKPAPWGLGGLPPRTAWPDWHTSGYDFTAALPPGPRRAFGLVFCIVAGALSGSTFTPAQYVVDHVDDFPGAPTKLSGHLFAHFTGILVTSTAVYVAYTAATRNRPWASPPLFLPAFMAGVVWAGAMFCWFTANERLSIVIAFPLVTLGPGLLSMLIGGIFFGEVRGWRSVAGLAAACTTFAAAAACIALSGAA